MAVSRIMSPTPCCRRRRKSLQACVVQEHAAVGVAFDGDGDRVGFIDEQGGRIQNDIITALIAGFLLTRYPGSTILYDLRSSRIVPETIAQYQGTAIRSRVGHSFIKEKMREVDALFAGELSGHFYYRAMGFTDNALVTMVLMLNLLSQEGKPLTEIVRPLERYAKTPELNFRVSDVRKIFAAIERKYHDARLDYLDGITVEYHDWWFNLRASNTEPLLRLNLEATDEALMQCKRDEVIGVMHDADPTLISKE